MAEALLHFDGTNGSTTIVDATGKHTWSVTNSAALDASQSKFGGSSLQLATTNDQVQGDGTIAWGTNDFTVDFWLRFNGTQAGQTNIFDINNPGGIIYIASAGGVLRFYNSGDVIIGGTAVTTDVWHHMALTKQGSNHYLFLDGVQQGSTYVNAFNYGTSPATYPQIGQGGGFSPVGWYDELRILIGTAAWTSNFTPPTSAYSLATTPPGASMYMI